MNKFNSLKTLALVLGSLTFASCDKDDNPIIVDDQSQSTFVISATVD